MKTIKIFSKYSLMLLAFVAFTGCSSDDDVPATPDTVSLELSGEGVESSGSGLYNYQVESGNDVSAQVHAEAPGDLDNLQITKTINNEVDDSFGTDGTMTINASGSELSHAFTYSPGEDDVDQLVNFTFEATSEGGASESVDLTVEVTLSPMDNLTRRRWMRTSIYWVQGEEEGIRECEEDDSWVLNEDGTMSVDYGEDTAEGECALDGLTEWTHWEITEEDGVQTFTRTGHDVFTEEEKVDVYEVEELTTEELVLSNTLDMTDFGYSEEETFIYTFEATAL